MALSKYRSVTASALKRILTPLVSRIEDLESGGSGGSGGVQVTHADSKYFHFHRIGDTVFVTWKGNGMLTNLPANNSSISSMMYSDVDDTIPEGFRPKASSTPDFIGSFTQYDSTGSMYMSGLPFSFYFRNDGAIKYTTQGMANQNYPIRIASIFGVWEAE